MSLKRLLYVCLTLLLLPGLMACTKQESQTKGKKIVTSFYPIYAMTKMVSGDLNDVRMIQSGAGIHGFEPSPNDVAAIHDADSFIYHSKTLETWAGDLETSLDQSQVSIFEASQSLELMRVQGLENISVKSKKDSASLYDPHTWTDPVLVGQEVQAIADYLSQLDPKNKRHYQANAVAAIKKTKVLTEDYQAKFAKVDRKEFVTQHTAFAYLAKRFNLTQLGIASVSEQEPNAHDLANIEAFVKEHQVKTIFTESNASPKMAQVVSKATGAKMETLSTLEADPKNNKDYLDNLKDNLESLYQSLRGE